MILLDPMDRRPIYEQIVEKLSALMISGVLKENDPLPSVRNMAADLSINPNTVQRAYLELEREGSIRTVKGKGSFVADLKNLRENHLEDMKKEFKNCALKLKAADLQEKDLTSMIHQIFNKTAGGGEENDHSR